MKALRLLTLMALCCATGTMTSVAWAAEPPPAKAATPAPAGESAAQKVDEPASGAPSSSAAKGTQDEENDADADEQQAAARPKAPGKGGASPERFVPSEQVRADFDVSFPIDI